MTVLDAAKQKLPSVPTAPGFRRLWFAATISEFGDWSTRLALAALLFARTNNPVWVGVVALVFVLPRFGPGQLLTSWSERLPRRRLLVVGDSTRALVFAMTAVLDLGPIPLLGLVLIAATIDPVFESNAAAATFDLLPPDQSDDGVRLRQVTVLMAQVAGMAAAGVALGWVSPQTILAANAGSFALSALIISGTSLVANHVENSTVGQTLSAAVRAVTGNPHLRAALATTTITIFGASAAEAQVIVIVDSQPSWVLPAASAVVPLGAAVAAVVASTHGGTRRVLRKSLAVTTVAMVTTILALGLEQPWSIVVAFALSGVMFQTTTVGQVIAVRHLPTHGRASVLSVLQTVVMIGAAAGAAVSGFAINAFGVTRGMQLCVAIAALAWLVPLPDAETEIVTTKEGAKYA